MRDYVLSLARHLAGAAAGALVGFLVSRGYAYLTPEDVVAVDAGVEALVVGASLAGYAAVEKGLKPLVERLFGGAGN